MSASVGLVYADGVRSHGACAPASGERDEEDEEDEEKEEEEKEEVGERGRPPCVRQLRQRHRRVGR